MIATGRSSRVAAPPSAANSPFAALRASIRARAVHGNAAFERLLDETARGLAVAGDAKPSARDLGLRADPESALPECDDEETIPLRNLHGVAALNGDKAPGRTRETQYVLGMTLELLRILARFEAYGIRAMALKGAALATRGYGEVARRSFWDLDLLLTPTNVRAGIEILRADGYVAEAAFTERPIRRLLADNCEYNLDHPRTGIHVELHWRFLPPEVPFGLDVETAIERATSVSILGRSIPALDPIDEIVYLAAHHGGKHDWTRLQMVCDIAMLTTRLTTEECLALLDVAGKTGTTRLLHTGTLLASALLNAPVPAPLLETAVTDSHARSLARHAASRIRAFDGVTRENSIIRARAYLRSRERPADRLAYLPAILSQITRPTDREQALMPLPPALRPLHIVLRPFRLSEKYLRLMFSRAFRVRSRSPSGHPANQAEVSVDHSRMKA